MELINNIPKKNEFYLKNIAKKCIAGIMPEPLTCNVIGVLTANQDGGLYCNTPCGREYKITVDEKRAIESATKIMLSMWCEWARSKKHASQVNMVL